VDREYYSLHKIWLRQWKRNEKVTKREKKNWLNRWFHEQNILRIIVPVRVQRWGGPLLVVGGRVHHVSRGGVCGTLARSSSIWCLLLPWRRPFGGLLTHSVFCKMLKFRTRGTCRGVGSNGCHKTLHFCLKYYSTTCQIIADGHNNIPSTGHYSPHSNFSTDTVQCTNQVAIIIIHPDIDITSKHQNVVCSAPDGELVSTTMEGFDGLDFMDEALRRPKLPPTENDACSPASLIGGKPCKERLKKLPPLDWLSDGDWGGEGERVQCSELPDSCSCGSSSSSERMNGSSFGRFTVNSTLV
jgi:hypothetical protein